MILPGVLLSEAGSAQLSSMTLSKDVFQHCCFQGRWQARSLNGGRVTDTGNTWPLFLAELPTEDCSVQTIIDDWHSQEHIHALSEAPHYLLIQLNRFDGEDGRRSQCRVQTSNTLSVPTYTTDAGQAIQLLQYRLVSFIIHKGVYSTSGHYQAATVHEDRLWLHDDGSKPKLQHDAEDTFRNTYLLCYQALPVEEAR